MAAQVLPSVVSLIFYTCLHPQCAYSRCTTLRQQEEVNARLCAPVEMGAWVCGVNLEANRKRALGLSIMTGRY